MDAPAPVEGGAQGGAAEYSLIGGGESEGRGVELPPCESLSAVERLAEVFFFKINPFEFLKGSPAEAFLNRAESYAMLNKDQEAYNDIYALVESRVEDINKVAIPSAGEDLKRFIFEERRRELCFEDFRWIDLKRTKLFAKQINHEFTDRNTQGTLLGKETYILMPNDPNYIFPIPQDEIDRNLDMVQNERVEKVPIKEEY